MTPEQILAAAKAKITDEKYRCKQHTALDKTGMCVSPDSKKAIQWCMAGAMQAVSGDVTHDPATRTAYITAYKRLQDIVAPLSIPKFNDSVPHADVMAAFDFAIASFHSSADATDDHQKNVSSNHLKDM